MNEIQIESSLRHAPVPTPPPGLRRALLAGFPQAAVERNESAVIHDLPTWRRWLPVLSFGMLLVGCLVVFGVQTYQMQELRREQTVLQERLASVLPREFQGVTAVPEATERERIAREDQELQSLRAEVAALRAKAQEFAAAQDENRRLQAERAGLAAGAAGADPLAAARDKSTARQCLNNLKQIGLAARMWANDHNTNGLPLNWVTMSMEMVTPKVLTCPGDTARRPALSWEAFDGSSVTYELPSATPDEREPSIIYTRCPIHGNVGLSDGSAIMNLNPDRTALVGGNLKLRSNATIERKP